MTDCLPEPCSCRGHRVPGVSHVVPCCDQPHIQSITSSACSEDCDALGHNHDMADHTVVGVINEIVETATGITASGGWCAPSQTIYDMFDRTVDLPDPPQMQLRQPSSTTTRVEYVIEPDDSDWDERETIYTSLDEAVEAHLQRVDHERDYMAVTLIRREVTEVVLNSVHGSQPAPAPRDPEVHVPEWTMPTFPIVPTIRGGINFHQFYNER